jgi:hypothetical protein
MFPKTANLPPPPQLTAAAIPTVTNENPIKVTSENAIENTNVSTVATVAVETVVTDTASRIDILVVIRRLPADGNEIMAVGVQDMTEDEEVDEDLVVDITMIDEGLRHLIIGVIVGIGHRLEDDDTVAVEVPVRPPMEVPEN